MILEGNPNHMMNQVDMSDAQENSENGFHIMGGMGSGTKGTLADSDKHYGTKAKVSINIHLHIIPT